MKRLVAVALVLAGALGCDWDHSALLNGVSFRPEPDKDRVVHVYLAVDGASWPAVVAAQQQGAFAGYHLAKAIPMFPATSDASWSRILHTPRFMSYEYTFYDQERDEVRNAGLGGVITHAAPHPHGSEDFPYYDAFDLHGAGYLDAAEKYGAPRLMFRAALDQLFVVLAGRLATQTAFTAYLLETDVVGHYEDQTAIVEMLVELSERIEQFKEQHPEATLKFTLFSDHGLDNVEKPLGHFVTQSELLRSVDVAPAQSFAEAATRGWPVWAVAPEHTRVTYGTLNTAPGLVADVAQRVSTSPRVDLVVARAEAPAGAPEAAEWVSLFLAGKEAVRFGFDPGTDTYWLPAAGDYAALGVVLPSTADAGWQAFTDEALFAATVERTYPDLFFRARTSLLPISIRNTADILFSLREDFALKGFSAPVGDEAGAAGSHGAMRGDGSLAMLLTEEREVPAAIRSENILEMFPALKAHLAERGVPFVPGDPNASLEPAAAGSGSP